MTEKRIKTDYWGKEENMRNRIIIGLILFVAGIILDVVHEIADIWILGVLAFILVPAGMVIGTNALISLRNNKNTNSIHQSTEDKKTS